jgi:hypothetical protein
MRREDRPSDLIGLDFQQPIISCSLVAAYRRRQHPRLSVVPSANGDVERETGLEPATFSLEGRGGLAQ